MEKNEQKINRRIRFEGCPARVLSGEHAFELMICFPCDKLHILTVGERF